MFLIHQSMEYTNHHLKSKKSFRPHLGLLEKQMNRYTIRKRRLNIRIIYDFWRVIFPILFFHNSKTICLNSKELHLQFLQYVLKT